MQTTARPTSDTTVGSERQTSRKFVRDVAVRLAFQVLNALKGLLYLPLISKQFGAHGYGIWSQIIISIALFSPALTLRLDGALARYLGGTSSSEERRRAFFGSLAVVWSLSLAVVVVGVLAMRPLALLMFGDRSLHLYVALFLFLLATRVNLKFILAFYRAIGAIKLYSALQTVQLASGLLALAILTTTGQHGLIESLLAFIAIDVALATGVLIDIARRVGFSLRPDLAVLKKYLGYSLPLVPAVALYWVVNSSDRYVIVHFLGLSEAGVYSAAYRLAQVMKLMIQPISFVLLPLVARMWEKGQEQRVRTYMAKSLEYFVLIALPMATGLIAVGPMALRLLGTREFTVNTGLISLLVLGQLFVGLYQIYVYVIYLKEKTWVQPVLFLGLAAFNLGLNVWLVPSIGMLGAAVTTFGAYFLQLLATLSYANRLFKVPFLVIPALKAALSSGIMYVVVQAVPHRGTVGLAVQVAVGIVVYFAVILAVKGIDLQEVKRTLRGGKRA